MRDTRNIEIGAMIQIEGSAGTYAVGPASSPNLLDSVQQLLTAGQVPFQIENASFGKYLKSVGTDANAWSYNVYRQGKWDNPQVGMADYKLQAGDRAVIYYSGYDANWNPTTYLVDSVTLNPASPKASESFTVTVKKTLGYDTPSPAAGIQLKLGDLIVTTNDQGSATFAGLPEGTYTLDISGYVTGASPKIVHTTQKITIAPRTGGTTGGVVSGGTGNPVVYLSVIGDSNKGTILSSTTVTLQSGDTAYSILIRTLGAGRVQSSGSGATAYVQGIDGLREFDRGPLSGWMYAVNGSFLGTGADAASLRSGDNVTWRYTVNGGADLNAGSGSGGSYVGGGAGGAALSGSTPTDAAQQPGSLL
ncbi:DUF4430 domain-containing protein [Paenibacillus sp. P25]|nr:DUF4430 domain-containing protein [Paenibacillus sp. P25]